MIMIDGQRLHTNLHLSLLMESKSFHLVYLVVSASLVCNNIWKEVMQANM